MILMASTHAASFLLMQEEQHPLRSVKRTLEPQNGALGMMLE